MFWLGLIVALCYVPGVTGAYIATQWPVLAVALTLILPARAGPWTVFHTLAALFAVYAALHALPWFTPTPQFGVFGLWLVSIMGLALWFGTTLTTPRYLYAGLAAGAAVSSAIAVCQFFGLDLVPRVSTTPAGLYVNSVQLGTVLALLVVALASERMWYWALPLLPGIIVSGSRGAWLALAVGLIGCSVRRVWIFGIVVLAGVVFLSLPLSGSDSERLLIWRAASQNLTLFGWGPGTFFNFLLSRDGVLFYPEYAHNDALQLLFEYGVAALLPFAVFGFALSCTAFREWPVVLAFVVASCYSMPLYMPLASFLALVAVGRILRSHALVCRDSDYGRCYDVQRGRGGKETGSGFVSVAPGY